MTFFESSSLSGVVFEQDRFGKTVSTSPDHAFMFEHDLFGKPVSTFPDHAFMFEHDLFGKPVSTFPDHAVMAVTDRLPIPKAADACATFARARESRES